MNASDFKARLAARLLLATWLCRDVLEALARRCWSRRFACRAGEAGLWMNHAGVPLWLTDAAGGAVAGGVRQESPSSSTEPWTGHARDSQNWI